MTIPVTLTDSTAAAMQRIATAPATSDQHRSPAAVPVASSVDRPACPTCGKPMACKYSKKRTDGGVTRRFECRPCSTSQMQRLGLSSGAQLVPLPPVERRFDAATILAIKNSTGSQRAVARQYGCSAAMVGLIRSGQAYRDLWDPALAVGTISCLNCIHWGDGGCSLGLPEAIEIGPQFARECAAWGEVKP